jgi:tellurite resistance protein TerC
METIGSPGMWAAFIAFVVLMLALDLGVFHRKAHVVGFKEAAIWSAIWVGLALLFSGWVFLDFGTVKGTEFLTGYVIEKSFSIDNVFVFVGDLRGARRSPRCISIACTLLGHPQRARSCVP